MIVEKQSKTKFVINVFSSEIEINTNIDKEKKTLKEGKP